MYGNQHKNQHKKIFNGFTFSLLTAAVFFTAVFFASCNPVNQGSLIEYLDRQSNEIKVVDRIFQKEYPVDKEGYISIPSNEDVLIQYLIQNPNGLKLDGTPGSAFYTDADDLIEYFIYGKALPSDSNFISGTVSSGTIIGAGLYDDLEDYNYSVNFIHNDLVNFKSLKELLRTLETNCPGQDFNPIIYLFPENYTWRGGQAPDPWEDKIRINTVPPIVQGACIMLDSGAASIENGTIGNYVVCFNLPQAIFDDTGIHRDVKKIYVKGVNGTKGKALSDGVDLNIDFAHSSWEKNYLPSSYSSTLQKIYYNNVDSGDGTPAVEFVPDIHPVYVFDEYKAKSKESRGYKIILEDEKGLKSTVEINTLWRQLLPIVAKNNGKIIPPYYNTDGSVNSEYLDNAGIPKPVFIRLGNDVSYYLMGLFTQHGTVGTVVNEVKDIDVVYEVAGINLLWGNTTFQEGSELESKQLQLYDDFMYQVKAFAHKDGYLDSVLRIWEFTIGDWIQVDVDVNAVNRYSVKTTLTPMNSENEIVFDLSEEQKKKDKEQMYLTVVMSLTIYDLEDETYINVLNPDVLTDDYIIHGYDSEGNEVTYFYGDLSTEKKKNFRENANFLDETPKLKLYAGGNDTSSGNPDYEIEAEWITGTGFFKFRLPWEPDYAIYLQQYSVLPVVSFKGWNYGAEAVLKFEE